MIELDSGNHAAVNDGVLEDQQRTAIAAFGLSAIFFAFANGGWMAANPVPEEYPRWGAFDELRKANDELLRALLEEAAADPGPPGTPRHWAGRYYRSGMDTDLIDSADLGPVRSQLDRIDQIGTVEELREVAADLAGFGISMPVAMGVAPDFEDSRRHLLYVGQGGLGFPSAITTSVTMKTRSRPATATARSLP